MTHLRFIAEQLVPCLLHHVLADGADVIIVLRQTLLLPHCLDAVLHSITLLGTPEVGDRVLAKYGKEQGKKWKKNE